jgi:hypothetical protein
VHRLPIKIKLIIITEKIMTPKQRVTNLFSIDLTSLS